MTAVRSTVYFLSGCTKSLVTTVSQKARSTLDTKRLVPVKTVLAYCRKIVEKEKEKHYWEIIEVVEKEKDQIIAENVHARCVMEAVLHARNIQEVFEKNIREGGCTESVKDKFSRRRGI